MNDEEIYIPDTVCEAVRVVRQYLNCDCADEHCPFDTIVSSVRVQDEERRILALEETRRRQEEQDKMTEYKDD